MLETRWDAETVPEADLETRQAHTLPLLEGTGSVVEVGSGRGSTLGLLARPHRLLVGIDISPQLLLGARHLGFENVQADAQQLPLASASFELALAQELLEHVADWQAALDELFRVARHSVIIMVPFREWLKHQRCPNCRARVPLYGHVHRFGPDSFARWQSRGRMTLVKVGPPRGWAHYWRKATAWLGAGRRRHREAVLRCPACGADLRPGLRWQRAIDRLWKLLTRKPEWLLVAWDLGG